MNKINFSPTLFFEYAKSPHWIWYDRFGDQSLKGDIPAMTQKFMDEGVLHEENYVKDQNIETVEELVGENAFQQTLELMKKGAERIYQGDLRVEKEGVLYNGRPDFLEKRPGKSNFGNYYYEPVDIKNTTTRKGEEPKLQYREQLAMYAWMLGEIQGFKPDHAAIINRDYETVVVDLEPELEEEMWKHTKSIIRILQGEEPPVRISSSAKESPWFTELMKEAKKRDDIALIYNVHEATLENLRKSDLKTIEQVAEMDPETIEKETGIGIETLNRIKSQAISLKENKVIWFEEPEIPEAEMKIYFDIEGDPFLKIDYLYGFWIVGDGDKEPYFKYFLAETPDDVTSMWKEFLAWIETLQTKNYKVYHYSPYEKSSIRRMTDEFGGSEALEEFKTHFCDLARIVRHCVIFPLYFYSIKDIAKSDFLNYQWRHPEASGAQSIFWYEKWLETGDRSVLKNIVDYNEDDVIATKVLHEWLIANNPH